MSEAMPEERVPNAIVSPAGRRRLTIAWLVPILAVVVVAVVGWRAWSSRGLEVTIAFDTADGLVVGDRVVYRGVTAGVVRGIVLDPSSSRPIVRVELRQDAAGLAREGTRFWIVRPRVSLQQVAGLETLVGPRYIEMVPGPAGGAARVGFEGLDAPPLVGDGQGVRFLLRAPSAGAAGVSAPVLYRGVPVGRVVETRLSADARSAEVVVAIDRDKRDLVRGGSRFWLSGGAGVDFGWLSGLSVKAGSLESVVSGAISFATPTEPGALADEGAVFELASEADRDWLRWSPAIPVGPAGGGVSSGG